ncbi:MAG: porin family protein [Pseudomonadota bacterium]|nr:porin family protein [Pseudomonadota bacterium]
MFARPQDISGRPPAAEYADAEPDATTQSLLNQSLRQQLMQLNQTDITAATRLQTLRTSFASLTLSPVTHVSADTSERGAYLIAGLYQGNSSISQSELEQDMAADGLYVSFSQYDTTRMVKELGLGYRYLSWGAVEFSYLDLGRAEAELTSTDSATEVRPALKDYYPVGGSGWMLAQRFTLPLSERAGLSASAGYLWWQGKIDTARDGLDVNFGGGLAPVAGLAADYRFSPRIRAGLQLRRIFFDQQQMDLSGIKMDVMF